MAIVVRVVIEALPDMDEAAIIDLFQKAITESAQRWAVLGGEIIGTVKRVDLTPPAPAEVDE